MESHEGLITDWAEKLKEAADTPVSQLVVTKAHELMNDAKQALKTVDVDFRDARRRIQAVKPKKNKTAPHKDEDSASSMSED